MCVRRFFVSVVPLLMMECNHWSHCACYNLTEVEAAGDDLQFLRQVCNPSVSANLTMLVQVHVL